MSLISSARLVTVIEIFYICISLFLSIFIARNLGPEGQGQYAVLLFYYTTFGSLGNLGIPQGIIHFNGNNYFSKKTLNMISLVLGAFGILTILILYYFLFPLDIIRNMHLSSINILLIFFGLKPKYGN